MLTYVSQGPRDFGDHPLAPISRPHWEIYAVTRGRLAPTFPGGPAVAPRSRTLWVFAPGCTHGWAGEPRQPCAIAVFHFDAVPEAVAKLARSGGGWFGVELASGDLPRLSRLARDLQPRWWHGDPLLEFHAQRALMDLAILLLSARSLENSSLSPELRIRAAEYWLRTHFHERPGVREIAHVLGVSQPTLRRLFASAAGCSPKEWMSRIQLEVAAERLIASDAKLEAVADESGFASCSTLCHAFRVACGLTPTEWRGLFGEKRSSRAPGRETGLARR